jgi:hypothetical protein
MFLTNSSKKLILILSLLNLFLPNQLIPLLLPKREKIKNSISFLQIHLSLMDGISLLLKMLNLITLGKIYWEWIKLLSIVGLSQKGSSDS